MRRRCRRGKTCDMIDTVLLCSKFYDFFKGQETKRFSPMSKTHLISIHVYSSICVAVLAYILGESFYSIEWPCFSINDCAVWLLSWNHVSMAVILVISACTRRRTETIRCYNESLTLAKKCRRVHRKSTKKILYYLVVVTVVFVSKTATSLLHRRINPAVFLVYSTSYLVPLIMECLVICLCAVVEDTAAKINEILTSLTANEYSNVMLEWNLKKVVKIHQESCNFMRTVTLCFDKDLLVDLTFNMIWFVIYIYIITVSLWRFDGSEQNLWKVCSVVLEVFFLTFRVCFLSYSVNCIDLQTTKFLHQIVDNEMKMQICGCFYVDLSFMRGVIGLATTYLVVFIQYGLGESSSITKFVNTTSS